MYPTIWALIASRLPRNPIGWIFCIVGLLYGIERSTEASSTYTMSENIALPWGEYVKVVRAVAGGEAYFGAEIAHRLMNFFSAPSHSHRALPRAHRPRARDPRPYRRGHSNAKIARSLFVSPKTVRNHISHIFTKLQIADRTQAILRAREAGLGGS